MGGAECRITLQVRLADAERDLASALQIGPAVAQALDGHQPRLWANGEALFVELPRSEPEPVTVTEVQWRAARQLLLGIDSFNKLVTLDLWQCLPGLLVSGRPGSGVSNALQHIARQAVAQGWQLWLIAGGERWQSLLTHCERVASQEEAAALLADLDDRLTAPLSAATLLVVDDAQALTVPLQRLICRLARLRGMNGLRSAVGTHEARRELLAALPTRLVGKTISSAESDLVTGVRGLTADKLLGKGDMLLVREGERVRRLQVALAEDGGEHVLPAA